MRPRPKLLYLFNFSTAAAFFTLLSIASCDDGSSSSGADLAEDAADTSDATSDTTGDLDAAEIRDIDASSDVDPDVSDTEDVPIDVPTTLYADSLLLSDRFLNIAHRGGRLLAPEETMVAFQNAVEVGADVLELDVHATSDGVLVVIHDREVDRTTDGTGLVNEQTLESLRQLDAGYHFSRDGGTTFPFRGQGVVIPTLEEVLTAFPEMHFIIEVKQLLPSIAEEVVAVVEELEMESRVCLSSFSDIEMRVVREANPDLITAYAFVEMFNFMNLAEEDLDTYEPVAELMQIPPEQGNMNLLSPEFLDRAHSFGLKVQVWTINSRAEMESMVLTELDGIMTDDPATLTEVIEAAGVND